MDEQITGPRDLNDVFIINEAEYRAFYQETYNQIFKPEHLIQTVIALPFQVPLDEGASFSMVGRGNICTFHFTTVTLDMPANIGILGENTTRATHYRSRVEMIYVPKKKVDVSDSKKISNCFDKLIEQLNKFLLAYLIAKRDHDVYRISREMLSPTTLVRSISLDPWRVEQSIIFLTDLDVPWERPTMDREEQYRLISFTPLLHEEWNPIVLSQELALNAMRCFKEGQYREAVMYVQTSVETLLDGLYKYLLVDEGNTSEQADKIIEKSAFMPTVRTQYQRRIGGNWEVNNSRTITGAWKKHTYSLRNKIVHEGYYPKYVETKEAIEKANRFRFYVATLAKKKKRRYPLTYSKFFM